MLRCSESVATLRRFTDTRSAAGWGGVAHALAAGLRQLLSEWSLFTAQLEHRALCGALPLQVSAGLRTSIECWDRNWRQLLSEWSLFTAQLDHHAMCGALLLQVIPDIRTSVFGNGRLPLQGGRISTCHASLQSRVATWPHKRVRLWRAVLDMEKTIRMATVAHPLVCEHPLTGMCRHRLPQALVSECQMPLRTLRLLAGLAAHASATTARGAQLLDLLARAAAAAAGDAAARPRLQALLASAAAPYFRVLQRWLAAGVLDDPHAEFLVVEQSVSHKAFTRFLAASRLGRNVSLRGIFTRAKMLRPPQCIW